jgi:hypothetical protein
VFSLFGLGDEGCEGGFAQLAMEIRWPNGAVKRFEPGTFGLNRYVTVDYAGGLAGGP